MTKAPKTFNLSHNIRARVLLNWFKMVFIFVLGFGGSFELRICA